MLQPRCLFRSKPVAHDLFVVVVMVALFAMTIVPWVDASFVTQQLNGPAVRTALQLHATSFTSARRRTTRARDLVQSLVQEQDCFSTKEGARAFAQACAVNIVYEDRFEPQPIVGKTDVTRYLLDKVAQRQGRGTVRLDRISDGNRACGFCWTWTTAQQEGLRGTTFVELNDQGEIQFVAEIPEPIFKPGSATKDLLQALTKGAEWPEPAAPYEVKQPTVAHELAKYLFVDLNANRRTGTALDQVMEFFDDQVVYRDFNYEKVLQGPAEVKQFIQDFTFPGIEFRPLRFDDGVDSTCFTWEVALMDAPDTIKGMSFYELDPVSRKIVYVRDVPESAIKPPILGKWARQLRPGLGVFQGVPLGSRPGGM